SAIVVGRVLRSHVEGLETVTDVAVEEAIKGDPGFLVQVHVPDGVLGAPSFAGGERVLLLLYRRGDGSFAVNDLQLGAFHFVKGLLLRDEAELVGWDPDGQVHEEDRKSTRLNSSHGSISYAVFCLKKKKDKSINKPMANESVITQRIHGSGTTEDAINVAVKLQS